MTRLAKKSLLRVEKIEQAYVYYPNLSQGKFISRFGGRILEDPLVSFEGMTLKRLEALTDQDAARRAEALLGEIDRRRSLEEDGQNPADGGR